jgi:secondary thiamine-phosphate synthase enzyme
MTDIRVHSTARLQLLDISQQAQKAVTQSGVTTGLCNLFVTHTTAAVIVSENWDPDVTSDLLRHLERLVPLKSDYRHGEGNSQAHILSVMLGTSIDIPVREGKLALGRWQGVMLAEFDGPRDRVVVASVAPIGA